MNRAKISYHYRRSFTDYKMERMHAHSSGNYEIMYVHKGSCAVNMPDRTAELSAGSFIVLCGTYPHAISVRSANILNIEFFISDEGVSLAAAESEISDVFKLLPKSFCVYSDTGEVYSALRDLIDELERWDEGVCSGLLLNRLFIELCRCESRSRVGGVAYIKQACEYIREHFCEKITVQEIADSVGLNRSYLQVLFKKHTGKTVVEYINTLRMEKACFIMKNTDIPIIDIAIDCGFSSRQHFMYVFKRHTGLTAREYRR